jgi:hypothetical protein
MVDFVDFLKGDVSKLNITPVKFLDYNIIETLTDEKNHYYGLLEVFHDLYVNGYWTYGGFKDFNGRKKRIRSPIDIRYGFKNKKLLSFTLTKDGKISGDNIPSNIVIDLKSLGAVIL